MGKERRNSRCTEISFGLDFAPPIGNTLVTLAPYSRRYPREAVMQQVEPAPLAFDVGKAAPVIILSWFGIISLLPAVPPVVAISPILLYIGMLIGAQPLSRARAQLDGPRGGLGTGGANDYRCSRRKLARFAYGDGPCFISRHGQFEFAAAKD